MRLRTIFQSMGKAGETDINKGWIKAAVSGSSNASAYISYLGYNEASDCFFYQDSENVIGVTKDFKSLDKTISGQIIPSDTKSLFISDHNGNFCKLDSENNLVNLGVSFIPLFEGKIAQNFDNKSIVFGQGGIMGGPNVYGSNDLSVVRKIDGSNYSDAMLTYCFYNPKDKYIHYLIRRLNVHLDYAKKTKDGLSLENSSVPNIFSGFVTNSYVKYIQNKFIAYGYYGTTNYLRQAEDIFGQYTNILVPNLGDRVIRFLETNKKENITILCVQKYAPINIYSSPLLFYTKDFTNWELLEIPLEANDYVLSIKYLKDRFVVYSKNNKIYYKKI